MGLFGSLFGITKMNADPEQQLFARMFIEAAETENSVKLTNWLVRRPWSSKETRTRIAHALSIVKISSVPSTYNSAKEIGMRFHQASYELD